MYVYNSKYTGCIGRKKALFPFFVLVDVTFIVLKVKKMKEEKEKFDKLLYLQIRERRIWLKLGSTYRHIKQLWRLKHNTYNADIKLSFCVTGWQPCHLWRNISILDLKKFKFCPVFTFKLFYTINLVKIIR